MRRISSLVLGIALATIGFFYLLLTLILHRGGIADLVQYASSSVLAGLCLVIAGIGIVLKSWK